MATRLYLSHTDHTATSPAISGTWTTDVTRYDNLVPTTPSDSALGSRIITYGGSSGDTVLLTQFVSPPIDGAYYFEVSVTTFTLCILGLESNSLANVFYRFKLAIFSNDGLTERDSTGHFTDGTEWSASALTARQTGPGTSSFIDYTTVPGDRMVLEMGFTKNSTTSYDMTTRYGDPTAGVDLSGDGDTGTSDRAWFEVSIDVGFDPEGTVYGNVPNQLMMTGVGL